MSRTVLITGAAGGIGEATAAHMASNGWRVGLVDRNPRVQDVATELDGAFAVECDIRDSENVDQAIVSIQDHLGPIDALVNNAGVVNNIASIAHMDVGRWQNEIAVNLSGAFYFIRRLAPSMASREWGRIVNVSSGAARGGLPAQVGYAATKSALWGLTATTASEFGSKGVTCNSILPGFIETPTVRAMPDAIRAAMEKQHVVGRFGHVCEVAHLVAFLCSEHAGFITGSEIDIDGGLRLNQTSITSLSTR